MRENLLITGPESASLTVILAHGAGAAMDTPFMETISEGLASQGQRVIRFEFPYMRAMREDGRRRPPNPQKALIESWMQIIEKIGNPEDLVIGGKSMGGRIASMVADEAEVRGLICLGYPFHAPGKQMTANRIAHLEHMRTPCLIVQGERDPFGQREEIGSLRLSKSVQLVFLDDGDHSYKPRVKSGTTLQENLHAAARSIHQFCAGL
jgi:predicted alpha/beta-hydrolase family hydrolase